MWNLRIGGQVAQRTPSACLAMPDGGEDWRRRVSKTVDRRRDRAIRGRVHYGSVVNDGTAVMGVFPPLHSSHNYYMRPLIYIETTISSYYCDDRPELAADIARTRQWWEFEREAA